MSIMREINCMFSLSFYVGHFILIFHFDLMSHLAESRRHTQLEGKCHVLTEAPPRGTLFIQSHNSVFLLNLRSY